LAARATYVVARSWLLPVVTLSTFVPLSINSAKGLSRWVEMLRCAQHDSAISHDSAVS